MSQPGSLEMVEEDRKAGHTIKSDPGDLRFLKQRLTFFHSEGLVWVRPDE